MDLGGCSASQARTHVGRGPTTGDQAVLSGPGLREASGPGRELGRRGCPGDRGVGRPGSSSPLLRLPLASSGAQRMRSLRSRELSGSGTCFGKGRAPGAHGRIRLDP